MSSGDMTTYIRGKQEERGNSDNTFMMDGFDRWAESDAPNRVGGMFKDPAERTHRRRRGRGLNHFDSDSSSDCDEGRFQGGARNYSDFSDSSDYSSDSSDFSDSSEELSGGRRRHRYSRGGSDTNPSYEPPTFDEYTKQRELELEKSRKNRPKTKKELEDEALEQYKKGQKKMEDLNRSLGFGQRRRHRQHRYGGEWYDFLGNSISNNSGEKQYDEPLKTSGYVGDVGQVKQAVTVGPTSGNSSDMSEAQKRQQLQNVVDEYENQEINTRYTAADYKQAMEWLKSHKKGTGHRNHRHHEYSDDEESEEDSLVRRTGGTLPNIVQYADMAQSGYNVVKGYLPRVATDFADKIFNLYNTIKENAGLFKAALSKLEGPNKDSALKVKGKIEELGFGRMPMKHTYKAMKNLDRKHGTKTHKLLKKMFGAGVISDFVYNNAPWGAQNAAKSAVETLIKNNATAAKFNNFVEAGKDMYDNVKVNMPLIRSAMNALKTHVSQPQKDKIDQVDNALKSVGLGRKGKRQPSQRNMMVSKLMREKGLTLGEASKQVSAMKKGGVGL